MSQISEELKTRIANLIPEDEELLEQLKNDSIFGVAKILKGYYIMADTVCRAMQSAGEEGKAERPDLVEICDKWGPKYGELEDILDRLAEEAEAYRKKIS